MCLIPCLVSKPDAVPEEPIAPPACSLSHSPCGIMSAAQTQSDGDQHWGCGELGLSPRELVLAEALQMEYDALSRLKQDQTPPGRSVGQVGKLPMSVPSISTQTHGANKKLNNTTGRGSVSLLKGLSGSDPNLNRHPRIQESLSNPSRINLQPRDTSKEPIYILDLPFKDGGSSLLLPKDMTSHDTPPAVPPRLILPDLVVPSIPARRSSTPRDINLFTPEIEQPKLCSGEEDPLWDCQELNEALAQLNGDFPHSRRRSGETSGKPVSRSKTLPPQIPPRTYQPLRRNNKENRRVSADPVTLRSRVPGFGCELFQVSEERDEEVASFCHMLDVLRSAYSYSDCCKNPGFVWSPAVARDDQQYGDGVSMKVTVVSDHHREPLTFTCDGSSTVDLLIYQTLCYAHDNLDCFDVDDFILKPCGLEEFLQNNQTLGSHDYIQQCRKFDCEIRLSLTKRSAVCRELARREDDDKTLSTMNHNILLQERPIKQTVTREALTLLLDTFHTEGECFLLAEADFPPLVERLVQSVKALCNSLAAVETPDITNALSLLPACPCRLQPRVQKVEGESVCVCVFVCVCVCVQQAHFSFIFYSNIFLNSPAADVAVLAQRVNRERVVESLTASILDLVQLYCATFNANFYTAIQSSRLTAPTQEAGLISSPLSFNIYAAHRIPITWAASCDRATFNANFYTAIQSSRLTAPTQEAGLISSPLSFNIYAAHRIPITWAASYEGFHLSCSLSHGGVELCSPQHTSKQVVSKYLFHLVVWDQRICFPVQINRLPRETQLTVTLYAMPLPPPGGAEEKNKQRRSTEALGWVTMPLFNFRHVLACGRKLLGLWPSTPESRNTRSSSPNFSQPDSVILQVDFPSSSFEVRFTTPPPAEFSPQYEFSRLDRDSQRQLQDVLHRKSLFWLTQEDRKLLWEKRYFCHAESGCLPLVLASAPSWEWACLPDIYALLKQWACMNHLDSLGLLHAIFPDQELRRTAVQWMDSISDPELLDFLPQLVQVREVLWTPPAGRVVGEVKLSISYKSDKLFIMVMHIRGLQPLQDGTDPDPYVKLYLLPDPQKTSKRKTKGGRRTCNPTYNEMLVYDGIPHGDLQQRVIHLRVLSEGAFWENTLLGETFIALRDLDLDPSHRRLPEPICYRAIARGGDGREAQGGAERIRLAPDARCARGGTEVLWTPPAGRVVGEVKLSISYKSDKLFIMVMHIRGLQPLQDGTDPDPYVKLYLLPDPQKTSKRKTKGGRRTCNPTYNEMLVYDGIPHGDLQQRVIHLRVLSEGAFWENTLLGETFIALRDLDLDPSHRRVGWYQLGTVGQDTVR
ncbi:UNVERIFIED_CONTAM: hypothetical protein FKN15_075491 [Acipenser sinensis]